MGRPPRAVTLPRRIGAVVFDCDGLLLDTEECWSRAEAALFAEHGFGFGPEQKDLLIGRTLGTACDNIATYFGRPDSGAQLQAELLPRVEAELAGGVNAMPGACALLERLVGRIPIGVATNSPRALLDIALASAGFDGFFAVSVAADEVACPKPDPQLFLRAFELLGAAPQTGVAFEDSPTGVAAARAAGAFLVTVPSQPGSRLDGDYVTDTLADAVLIEWAQTVLVE